MSQPVRDYYNRTAQQEWQRLDNAQCRLEFAGTLYLIDRYFPKTGRVCDIGGGPGRYAVELARRGYRVTLFDLSEAEVALARTHFDELGLQAEQLLVGDARDLGRFAAESYDAALLMGPMYHVIDSGERAGILQELKRILKPQATAVIAYLNAWGLLRTGVTDFPDWYKDIGVLHSMLEGRSFTARELSGFTESCWSTPPAALGEVEAAGLEVVSYAGVESFAGGMQPLMEKLHLENPQAYANVVRFAAETCELEQFRDSSDHLHIVARKGSNTPSS